ncbi:MAG TPA: type VII secretion protein EccC, partial [Mycobacterium sp.]|nr:type VII secretion protein EccC [Mycobacterium sp.]
LAECGKDELLVTLGQSVMSRLRPDEVRITVIDPKAKLTGRIDGAHVDRYCYEADDIADTLETLAAQLRARLPQAGLSQQQLQELARRGFDGPRQVLLLNDAHMLGARGQFGEKPPATAPIAELVTRASEIGLHVFATRHTGNWDSVYAMDQFVVAMKNSRAPILFMDNDPDNCTITGRIRAPHLPPGRGILLAEEKREGVLVGLYDNES